MNWFLQKRCFLFQLNRFKVNKAQSECCRWINICGCHRSILRAMFGVDGTMRDELFVHLNSAKQQQPQQTSPMPYMIDLKCIYIVCMLLCIQIVRRKQRSDDGRGTERVCVCHFRVIHRIRTTHTHNTQYIGHHKCRRYKQLSALLPHRPSRCVVSGQSLFCFVCIGKSHMSNG